MALDGSIRKPNGSDPSTSREPKSSLKALEHWLGVLGETYKNRWNAISLMAYRVSLEDLTAEQIERACKRVLQTWTLATMPPPGIIRECAATVDPGEHREEYLGLPAITYPEISQEEREAALADAEYQEQKKRVLSSELRIVASKKLPPKPESLVIAEPDRVWELERQRKKILSRYGKPV